MLEKNNALRSLLEERISQLAGAEELAEETIRSCVDAGTMVLLANPEHKGVRPTLIGQPASVKVNANIGTSPKILEPETEDKKLELCDKAGAHTVMDLSTGGELDAIRRAMLAKTPLPLGTVPVYAVAAHRVEAGAQAYDFTADELLQEIELQAQQGVDFMTVHCGLTRRGAKLTEESGRVMGIVSRGGSIMTKWMQTRNEENPLLTRYDELLEIVRPYNVTLSLGDGLRPGAGADAGDAAQWDEVVELSRLARQAREYGVQAMIEGPGHVPLHLVEGQIRDVKRICDGAPLYVLGPLVTDSAPGYDHIAGAIGGALAVRAGVDFLCYLTPAEHLTLPGPEDVWLGVKASLVAAQAGEVALGRKRAVRRDLDMSKARKELDWETMADLAIDPDLVRMRSKDHADKDSCGMCGAFCAVRLLSE